MKDLNELLRELDLEEDTWWNQDDIYRNEILEDINEWLDEQTETQDLLESILRRKNDEEQLVSKDVIKRLRKAFKWILELYMTRGVL